MMKYVFYTFVSSLTSFLSLLLTNKILFAIIIFLFNLGLFILCEYTFIKKENNRLILEKDLYYFIHDFYLGYMKNSSLKEAFNFANLHVSNKLLEQIKVLDEYDELEKLNRLSSYFNNNFYLSFVKSISNNNDSIKYGFINIINENNDKEINNKTINKYLYRSLIEYIIMWLIAFLLILIIRLLIHNQFSKIGNSLFYLIGIGVFFIVFIFSNYYFIKTYYKNKK